MNIPEMLTRLIKMLKIAAKSGKIINATTSPVDKMTRNEPCSLSANSLPILCQGLSFPSLLV